MKICTLVSAGLFTVLWFVGIRSGVGAPVDAYTESFAATHQNWVYGPGAGSGFATWEPTGGPDGSSHIQASLNSQASAEGASLVLFQGRANFNASNGEFVGSWIDGGIHRLSAWVRHNAPVPLPYFARVTNMAGFPGAGIIDGTLVAPNTWTKLEYEINTGEIGDTIFPETIQPATDQETYEAVFGNVGRVQFGFNVPAALANSATSYLYQLDQVSIVPEPGSIALVVGTLGVMRLRRRRFA